MYEQMTDTLAQDGVMGAYWRCKQKALCDCIRIKALNIVAAMLSSFNMEASMSRRGNCWGNPVAYLRAMV